MGGEPHDEIATVPDTPMGRVGTDATIVDTTKVAKAGARPAPQPTPQREAEPTKVGPLVRPTALGDVIAPGATRYYQVYYRDPQIAFCPQPNGNSWNVSSGLIVVWP